MAFYLIGGRGRLGRAIATEYAARELIILDRAIYEDWVRDGAADQVSRYFQRDANESATVFVASGLLDPNLPQQDLFEVNYMLPKNVIDGASKLGVKVVTFGTVMEGLAQSQNPYVRSKAKLGNYANLLAGGRQSIVHIQLHTLYGVGYPSSFMFLGQMLSAIQANQPFRMTSGRQLREYHHLNDEAVAIRMIAESSLSGAVNLSHGNPRSLRDIAENVLAAFGKSGLLCLGALPEPPDDNYDQIFQSGDVIRGAYFRDPLPAIVQYIESCYALSKAQSWRN